MDPLLVPVPPPTRVRHDERLIALFLAGWQGGRFAAAIDWPRQDLPNVAAMATDAAGNRLAIAHTRLWAFEQQQFQQAQLAPLAAALQAEPRLDLPGRHFHLRFSPGLLAKALARHPDPVRDALLAWAVETLPGLALAHAHRSTARVALPSGKVGRVRLAVEVRERAGALPAVAVSVAAPCLLPVLRQALAAQLPRLAAAPAESRVLLLEVATAEPAPEILATLEQRAGQFPLLDAVASVVVADTSGESVVFSVGDPARAAGSAVWQPWITGPPAAAPAGPLAALTAQAREFAAAAKAANTLRAYAADWRDFRDWCAAHALCALPAAPETVALYLTDRAATLKTSSLARRLTTIARAHEAAGHPSPATLHHAVVSEVWKGIRRTKGTAPQGKKPFLTADLRQILAALPEDLQGARDRALLLVGFAGGFRRSELAALRCEDLAETPAGRVATLRRSKTDPEGQGRPVALPYGSDPRTCPVRALTAWTAAAGITAGALFRAVDQWGLVAERALSPDAVAWIVKRAVRRAGLEAREYAGHSLRAGLATQAAINGAGELAIMKQTGHRSLATLRRYIRDGSLFRDNAATKLGL